MNGLFLGTLEGKQAIVVFRGGMFSQAESLLTIRGVDSGFLYGVDRKGRDGFFPLRTIEAVFPATAQDIERYLAEHAAQERGEAAGELAVGADTH